MKVYVVYSGDIKNSISEYDCGINTYKVHAISMSNEDGDKVFDEIIDKLSKGKDIDKQDIIKLTFTPIMGGRMDKKDLEQVKEELRVTEIGKSLIEEGIQKGKIEGERKKAMEIAKSLLDVLSIEMIANKTGLTVEEVQSLKEDNK